MAYTPAYIAITSMMAAIKLTDGRLTERDLVKAALEDLTPDQAESLESDSCYYYESREGPFDYLIERAIMFKLIAWNPLAQRYELGANAPAYM